MKKFRKLKLDEIEIFKSSKVLHIYVCINENSIICHNVYTNKIRTKINKIHIVENVSLNIQLDNPTSKIIKNEKYYNLLISKDLTVVEMGIDIILNDNKRILNK